jgi:ribosome-binding protein aMBF1 (putative translation factor)
MGKVMQTRPVQRTAGTATKTTRKAARIRSEGVRRSGKPSLREMNRQLSSNYAEIMREARANCRRLTGQETL